ncbi:PIN domain-containing protein [Granulosicoccus sp. 3-233]|uniref:PIN domain-containing protein n=1 Tax=Granulosicoccus sp. 3-233 TaxID=3417969 RepID=UPI003D341C5F
MSINYVLIDYENVQPSNLELLADRTFRVLVFCGLNQHKISFELAAGMQKLGDRAEYIRTSGNGKNALDFHIAFHLGRLSLQDPGACLHIVSRDKGFEPLVAHMKSYGVSLSRVDDVADIPVLRKTGTPTDDDRIAAILENLVGRGQSRPRKVDTLKNTINTLFGKKLGDQELLAIVETLKARKVIVINGDKVAYKLPSRI